MKADRVVADTNVLISAALLPDGRPRAVVDAVRSANGVLLFSDETFGRVVRHTAHSHRPVLLTSAAAGVGLLQHPGFVGSRTG